jgi:transcriptional regulator with XRE-family HTH domain
MNPETIGDRIRRVRGALSQDEFAAQLGISKSAVGKYERGERQPDSDALRSLRDVRGVDINWLLTGEGVAPGEAMRSAAEIDARLVGLALEQVSAAYKECGYTVSLRDQGAKAAEIAADLAGADFPTWDDKLIGLKGAVAQLRRQLRAAIADPASATASKYRE